MQPSSSPGRTYRASLLLKDGMTGMIPRETSLWLILSTSSFFSCLDSLICISLDHGKLHSDCRSVYFGEYECIGPGANYSQRAAYAKQLDQCQAASFMDISYIEGKDWALPPRYSDWYNPCADRRHRDDVTREYQNEMEEQATDDV
ncbi:hypothetical protein Cni_G27031 [Canna indica]|uniref:Pectinesterase n=1 Tax=Canna indica TaxID=4628 RepID=A0AAQ3QR10_9LILI|nr:hypothetical protein Cni_G27031 [Canna indica]